MSDVICPYCEQDRVWRVALADEASKDFSHAFCYECDTFWENGEVVDDVTGRSFKLFLQERGEKLDYGLIVRGNPATQRS